MNQTIDIESATASPIQETHVAPPQAEGWMAWYKYATPGSYWSMVYATPGTEQSRDYYRTPHPLFASREDAISAAKYCLGSQGGVVKTVKITL